MIYFTPFGGSGGGGAPLPPSTTFGSTTRVLGSIVGMNTIVSSSYDDTYVNIILPFSVNFLGTTYSNVCIGSNSYATFGTGSGAYSSISGSNPPIPGIHISAADNSYQRVFTISESSDLGTAFRIRYEGTNSPGGVVGAPNMVWELTFYQSYPKIIDVVIGSNAKGAAGSSGVTNGSAYLYVPSNPSASYRITTG